MPKTKKKKSSKLMATKSKRKPKLMVSKQNKTKRSQSLPFFKSKILAKRKNKKFLPLAVFVVLFGAVGSYLLISSKAATPEPIAGVSAMALKWGQQNYLGDTSKYRYVILADSMYASVPTIKAANPNTKVLVYKNMAATNNQCQYDDHRSSGVSYCFTLQNHPEWFLRDASGQPFPFCDFANLYWMDIANTAYQQQWLDDVTSSASTDGFDGIFMDDTNTRPGHCMNGDKLAKYTDLQYGQAMQTMVAKVGPGLKNTGLVAAANVGGDPWTLWQNNIALAMAPNLSVFFREHFMHNNSTSTGLYADNAWLNTMKQMESVSQSTNFLGNTYSSATDTQAMLYGRASFLLGWNGGSGSAFQYHVDAQVDSYNSLWATDIGTPLAARYLVGTGPAWRRDFTSGTAVVNPSSTQTITISLGGTYTDTNGGSVTSITLGPTSAKILKKVASDITPPSQPMNLTSPSQTSSSITLSWNNSTDEVGVGGYDVYRNNSKITTVATNSYNDTGLNASTLYSYYVIARDAAGNSSPASNTITTTTQAISPPTADTVAPIVTISSPVNGSTVGRSVTINATATDNVKVTKMEVWIDGVLGTPSSTSGSISYSWNSRKTASGTHTITVKAYDAAGNPGQSSVMVAK